MSGTTALGIAECKFGYYFLGTAKIKACTFLYPHAFKMKITTKHPDSRFCVPLCVNICIVFIHVHMCTGVCVCVQVAVVGDDLRPTLTTFFLQSHPLRVFETGSLTGTWNLSSKLDWVASKSQGSVCLYLSSAEIIQIRHDSLCGH